ncbi:MAG: protein kinase [Vicinamibacterales bacterium]
MALTPGTRLGVYEITAKIGEGGMGSVYRATDTTLGRQVAIKILPDAFAADPDRVARFEREAKTLAALNHPHIAAIYGFEKSAGLHALVMELVEGEDLSQRIARGAIPVDEALPIAKQITDALEAAHEQGIIHRDLKPANIKLRSDGTVKVLDFGLAKAIEPLAGSSPNMSMSPTITTPAMTQAGMILGTAAYMSPEQARGKTVDKRTDIWAFGCVLFEMLTGTRAFAGDDVSEVLASVLAREPDWARLPASLSPAQITYTRRCLHKDLRQRIHDIADVRLALEGAFETARPQAGSSREAPRRWTSRAGQAAGLVFIAVALTALFTWFSTRPVGSVSPRIARLGLALPSTAAVSVSGLDRDLAITPDGDRVVYVGNHGTQLFVRALTSLEPTAVFTGAPRGPFVSPDGKWIAFFDGNAVKKVGVSGGPTVSLGEIRQGSGSGLRGTSGTWGEDGTLILARAGDGAVGLQRMSASGGPVETLTKPDPERGEGDHLWPEWLPGGRTVLFTIQPISGGPNVAQVALLDVQTGQRKVLVRGGSHAHYVPSRSARLGHLVFVMAGTLRAIPFDTSTLEITGTPEPVVPNVLTTLSGGVDAVVSRDGTLAYVAGTADARLRTLAWVDREGVQSPVAAPPRSYLYPRLSPDGTRVAVSAEDQEYDLWLWDDGRTTLGRLTFDPALDSWPVWTPNGRRVIFRSQRGGAPNIFWVAADGTGDVERLTESANAQFPTAVSPDGLRLIFTETTAAGGDIMVLMLDGSRRVLPLLRSPFSESNGVVSPDGRWLAYSSNESGRVEVIVRPFPDVESGHWLVSTAGGSRPLWARSGRELFYVAPTGALMRVGVERASTWMASAPTPLLKDGSVFIPDGSTGRMFDVAPDGRRFLMVRPGVGESTGATPDLIVVQHFDQELERLVPSK